MCIRDSREAIASKYLDGKLPVASGATGGDGGDDEENDEGMFVKSSNGQKIEIQLCLKKEDPNAVLGTLDRVYLPDATIHTAGEPGDAASCGLPAAKVRILDLAGNLMRDWDAVAAFGPEFPALRVLDITGVRAAWPSISPPGPSPFPNLSILVMNRSGASWREATAILGACPSLRELSLADCGISRLGEGDGDDIGDLAALAGLEALNLERNDVEEWSEVEKLALLPSLERLHLGGNRLRRVRYPRTHVAKPRGPVPFERLRALLLADNAIDDWDSVDALNDFPSIAEVRLTGNPVTESAATRHEIVARVARLSQLNGSLIADQERKDAEIRYLRRVLGLVKSAEGAGPSGFATCAGYLTRLSLLPPRCSRSSDGSDASFSTSDHSSTALRSRLSASRPANAARSPRTPRSPSPRREMPQSASCLLYTSPSPRDATLSRMPSSA